MLSVLQRRLNRNLEALPVDRAQRLLELFVEQSALIVVRDRQRRDRREADRRAAVLASAVAAQIGGGATIAGAATDLADHHKLLTHLQARRKPLAATTHPRLTVVPKRDVC